MFPSGAPKTSIMSCGLWKKITGLPVDDQGKVEGLPPLPPVHSADEDFQEDTVAPVADQHEGDEDAHLPMGF